MYLCPSTIAKLLQHTDTFHNESIRVKGNVEGFFGVGVTWRVSEVKHSQAESDISYQIKAMLAIR